MNRLGVRLVDWLRLPWDVLHCVHGCDHETRIDAIAEDCLTYRRMISNLERQRTGLRDQVTHLEASNRRERLTVDRLTAALHSLACAEAAQRARAEHAEARLHANRIPLYDLLPQQRATEERTAS